MYILTPIHRSYSNDYKPIVSRFLKKLILVFLVIKFIGIFSADAFAQEAIHAPKHLCDELAANPLDPDRVSAGIRSQFINPSKAIFACEDAVSSFPKELRFQFQLGRAYRQAGQYIEAIRWYKSAAVGGYAGAQNSLGVMYALGEGLIKDCNKAAYWIGLAAVQLYPAAIRNLNNLRCTVLV